MCNKGVLTLIRTMWTRAIGSTRRSSAAATVAAGRRLKSGRVVVTAAAGAAAPVPIVPPPPSRWHSTWTSQSLLSRRYGAPRPVGTDFAASRSCCGGSKVTSWRGLHTEKSAEGESEGRGGGALVDTPAAMDTEGEVQGFADVPGVQHPVGGKMVMVFTCKVCNTRAAKAFSKKSYEEGVVLVRCPGCDNLHLVADRLGWFDEGGGGSEGWDIEKIVKDRTSGAGGGGADGKECRVVTEEGLMELTYEDIAGRGAPE